VSTEAATVRTGAGVFGFESNFEAMLATRAEVCSFGRDTGGLLAMIVFLCNYKN